LDLIAVAVDLLSVIVLIAAVLIGWKAIRAFKQSRQTVTESASLLSVIVNALASRIESSESIVNSLRPEFESVTKRTAQLEGEQSNLRTSYLQVLRYLQEILSNDKRLVLELEHLKSRLTSIEQKPLPRSVMPAQTRSQGPALDGDILAALTPTERQTVEILGREGPKAAPELGRRMRKSREHMARLMKKLYMEGYVDRESNHAPFRYKLNEKVREVFDSRGKAITAAASEKA
jgi:DNA-binding MarR family transcriptional regulator